MMKQRVCVLWLLFGCLAAAQPKPAGWWMTEPIRWVQTNLRQTDATLDARHLVDQLADMRANVLLFGMGGIAAYYPTQVEFHYASPDLPAGRDLFGDVLNGAHGRRIRVVGRFDFSKTQKRVFDAHPEWFFRQANGEPVIYNGLYSTCINGGYYRAQVEKILTEALERYDVDGLFFNMFGNQSRDYSGREVGLCHCEACRTRYRAAFHKELPDKPDDDYRKFMFTASREVAAEIGTLIHAKRPKAGYFNYIQEATDGIMAESNTAVDRALPLWPYSASDNVNRARNSEPYKMSVNLNMQFVDMWWRFATVPRAEIALRMWQNMAHGGALTFEVNGTLDQQDRQAVDTAKPIFHWAAENEQYYSRQQSAARVLLLGASQKTGRSYRQEPYRGVFRMLSEDHIPFAVSDNAEVLAARKFDVAIATEWAPAELQQFAEHGGRVLLIGPHPPDFPVDGVGRTQSEVKGYLRVRDHARFPSLKDTELLLLNGAFTEVRTTERSPLTLVPPSMIGPPELVHVDQKDTDIPGIVVRQMGRGSVTWIPWDLGALYYRLSLPAHSGLFRDVMDGLMPERQLRTSAHPLVEVSLMTQGDRTMVHLINMTGQSGTGYYAPVPMRDIRVSVEGTFVSAITVRKPGALTLKKNGKYSELVVPELLDYEMVVLQ
jgi:hypothetical protein